MRTRNREYEDFSLRLHNKTTRRPAMGQFELTHRCNLRCQHCYIVNNPGRQELTYSELRRIFDEVHNEGCLWLCLTGGEPLLREDFLDIYSYAHKKGFIITIFTSATLLNKDIAEYLNRFPPFFIDVTLNGITKKIYELVTQTPASFKKAVQGIELILRHNLPMRLKCQAMTLNADELSLIHKFSRKIGVSFQCGTSINPRIDGSTEPCSLRLPVEKALRLQMRKDTAKGRNEMAPRSDYLFRCPGGTQAFHVSPYGELFLCNLVREPSWDLRNCPFKQGFYEFFPEINYAKFRTKSKCRACRLWHACLTCPGSAKLEYGNPEAPVDYYCRLAHLAAKRERACPREANSKKIKESGRI